MMEKIRAIFCGKHWFYIFSLYSILMTLAYGFFYATIGSASEAQEIGYLIYITICGCMVVICLLCPVALKSDGPMSMFLGILCEVLLVASVVGYIATTILLLYPPSRHETERFLARRMEENPRFLNLLEEELQCCGINSSHDYIPPYPESCCIVPEANCGENSTAIHPKGCLDLNYNLDGLMEKHTECFWVLFILFPWSASMIIVASASVALLYYYKLLQHNEEKEENQINLNHSEAEAPVPNVFIVTSREVPAHPELTIFPI